MFCIHCGNKLSENARFCRKCGAKVDNGEDIAYQEEKAKDDFRQYINNHIQMTTKYQSAEELLNSKVSQKYVWVCFGVPAVVLWFYMMGGTPIEDIFDVIGPVLLVIAVVLCFIAYPIALLVDTILSLRTNNTRVIVSRNIDAEELILFLNKNLYYLAPYFHEWNYIVMVGIGVSHALFADAYNAMMGTRIGTAFGRRKSCFVEIYVGPSGENPDWGVYSFGASMKSFWPAKYSCKVKAVPILQAAMEYYLNISHITVVPPRSSKTDV